MDVLVLALAGRISFEQAIAHCHRYWHAHARKENEWVVRSFWDFTTATKSKVYGRSFLAAPVGRWRDRNIMIGIRSPLIRVTPAGEILAVMPVFRKNFVPNATELNISLTAVREFCLREGYPDIDPELIIARGVKGRDTRQLIVERGSQRQLYASEQFDAYALKYSRAVAILADAGLGLERPNLRGYRVWDPDQPSFELH